MEPRDLVVAQVEHGELVWKERLVGKLRQTHAPYYQVRVEALAPGLALSSVALVSPLVNALSTRGIRVAWP